MILIGTGTNSNFRREITISETDVENEKSIMELDAGEELTFQTKTDTEYFAAQ